MSKTYTITEGYEGSAFRYCGTLQPRKRLSGETDALLRHVSHLLAEVEDIVDIGVTFRDTRHIIVREKP